MTDDQHPLGECIEIIPRPAATLVSWWSNTYECLGKTWSRYPLMPPRKFPPCSGTWFPVNGELVNVCGCEGCA